MVLTRRKKLNFGHDSIFTPNFGRGPMGESYTPVTPPAKRDVVDLPNNSAWGKRKGIQRRGYKVGKYIADSIDPIEIGYSAIRMMKEKVARMLSITFKKYSIGAVIGREIDKTKQDFCARKGIKKFFIDEVI